MKDMPDLTGGAAGRPGQSLFVELMPELLLVLRRGYQRSDFVADLLAGLTVAILALPLSLAIAIGSGAEPAKGLISSVIGGVMISVLGGTRFQIGGPAAAFIVVISGIVAKQGYDGLLIASVMAGLILVAAAVFRFGTFVKYVPGPVILGFTSGLGVVIAVGQFKDFFGLKGDLPAEFVERLEALWAARGSLNTAALTIGALSMAIVLGVRHYRPRWPGLLMAIVVASALVWALHLDVETVGSRFGAMPRSLPSPGLPGVDLARLMALAPTALMMAFLIGVESLLSAVTADAIAGTRHRPNAEMLAQGLANITTALFGGLPVTGVIARTGTNIHAGARTPVAGVIHALVVLSFVVALAPLVAYLALPCLAAVLLTIAWRLVDLREIMQFLRTAPRDDALVCAVTGLLTIFVDLNVAISVGVLMAALFFMHRMAELPGSHEPPHDPAAAVPGVRQLVFRGPLFFGQSARVADALRDAGQNNRVLLLDLGEVPLIDATGIGVLEDLAADCRKHDCRIIVASLNAQPRSALHRAGFLKSNRVIIAPTVAAALERAKSIVAESAKQTAR